MPLKFRLKKYQAQSVYHIYNRGIDGREVFGDDDDYHNMLGIIDSYLLLPSEEEKISIYKTERPYILKHKKEMNLAKEIELLGYCLMPDHWHMLVWQEDPEAIVKLVRRIMTKYVMYFNQRYKRHGPLFESVYRGVKVDNREQTLDLLRYLHFNPMAKQVKRFGLVETVTGFTPEYYLYSSYKNYFGQGVLESVKTGRMVEMFDKSNYRKDDIDLRRYLREAKANWEDLLGDLVLE
jgi:putative transposase